MARPTFIILWLIILSLRWSETILHSQTETLVGWARASYMYESLNLSDDLGWASYASTKENAENTTVDSGGRGSEHYDQEWMKKLGKQLNTYVHPILIITGFVGNTLSLLVMIQHHNRCLSSCNYMAALAIADTGTLASVAYYWFKTDGYPSPIELTECAVTVYMAMTFTSYGVYLIVSMTVERFLAIRFPLKSAIWCTPNRARFTIATLGVIMAIYNIPYFLYSRPQDNNHQCHPLVVKNPFTTMYSIANLCMNSVVPFVILLALNIFIIITIQKRKDILNIKDNDRDGFEDTSASKRRNANQKSTELQLTMMLLLVSFTLLILTSPNYIRIAVFTFTDHRHHPAKFGTYVLVSNITNKFITFNNVCNFFLYAISGSKFRHDLAKMFHCPLSERVHLSSMEKTTDISNIALRSV